MFLRFLNMSFLAPAFFLVYSSSSIPGRIPVKQRLTLLQTERDHFYYTFGSVFISAISSCIVYLRLSVGAMHGDPTIPGSHEARASFFTQDTGGGRWQPVLIDGRD